MKLTIKSYRKNSASDGNVKGWADVYFDDIGLTVCDVAVIKKKDGSGVFYGLPQKKIVDKQTGEEKYKPIVGFFSGEEYKAFHGAITGAFKVYFQENNAQEQPVQQQQKPTPSWQQNSNPMPWETKTEPSYDNVSLEDDVPF